MEIIEESAEYGYKLVRLPSGHECAVTISVNGYSKLPAPVICIPIDASPEQAQIILETHGVRLWALGRMVEVEFEVH